LLKFSRRACYSLILAGILAGCASSPLPAADVVATAIRQKRSADNLPASAQLNPAYRYLRVQVSGQPPALLVLGYISPNRHGDIEVWYSARGEVVKVQNGRIVGTGGLETDWISVRASQSISDWAGIKPSGANYERLRDVKRGYKDDIFEKLHISLLDSQALSNISHVPEGLRANPWRWFLETVTYPSAYGLPPAIFAWGKHGGADAIVYSRQCLSETFCLTLQAWPPEVIKP
jgi:Group 4 capsule polysaccharide lipoprotein gfcB, YjbF